MLDAAVRALHLVLAHMVLEKVASSDAFSLSPIALEK